MDQFLDPEVLEYFLDRSKEPLPTVSRGGKAEIRFHSDAGVAQHELTTGLQLSYADVRKPNPRVFFKRACEIAKASLETKGHKRVGIGRGILLRTLFYATALMGKTPKLEWLESASLEFNSGCDYVRMDDYYQQYFLSSVRMNLMVGNVPLAKEMMDSRRIFTANAREFRLINTIIKAMEANDQNAIKKLKLNVQTFFGMVRRPD